MTNPGACYRCGSYRHFAAQCDELQPPGSRAEHERRLALYLERLNNWLDGIGEIRWTPEQKTRAIQAENKMWNDEQAKMTTARRN